MHFNFLLENTCLLGRPCDAGQGCAFAGVPVAALHALLGWHVLLGLAQKQSSPPRGLHRVLLPVLSLFL